MTKLDLKLLPKGTCALGLASFLAFQPVLLASPSPAAAPKRLPQTWIERLRQLLNIQPVEAVGGSRGAQPYGGDLKAAQRPTAGPLYESGSYQPPEPRPLCLLSPISTGSQDALHTKIGLMPPVVQVGVTNPTIVVNEPLSEIILQDRSTVLWYRLASSTQAIPSQIPWPVSPLRQGSGLTLKIRAVGDNPSTYQEYRLLLADADVLNVANQLFKDLGPAPTAWSQRLIQAVEQQDRLTAAIVLSAPAFWTDQPVGFVHQLCPAD
jgi:hypothetical protein